MLQKIVDFQIKYAKLMLVFLLVIVSTFAYIGTGLEIESDFGILISDDAVYNVNDRILNNAFEANDGFLLSISLDDQSILNNRVYSLDDSRVDSYIDEVITSLQESTYVIGVAPPIYSDDLRLAQIPISLQTPNEVGSYQKVLAEMNVILEEVGEPAGVNAQITGLPILLDQIAILLVADNLNTMIITLAAIFGILYWYSRDVTFSLITMATPIVSLIMLAGSMVLLDIPITFTLAAVSVLVLGLGIDYGIHIAIHYDKARKHHESHKMALYHTINDLKLPITASFLTTFAGFIALMFGLSPATQAQGIVLGIGIAIIYSTTFILFPMLMTIFYKRLDTKENQVFQKILEGFSKLAAYQTKYAKAILWIVGIITIFMIYGASQVQFSTSNSNWIPEEDPVSVSFREINYQFGNTESFSMVIIANEGDLRNSQTVADIQKLEQKFLAIPEIEAINSPFTDLSLDSNEIYTTITDERSDFFNRDYTLTQLSFVTANLGEDDEGQSLVYKEAQEILTQTPVSGADVSFYGDIVRFDELGSSLQQDAGTTTLMGFGLVFLVASILYASLAIGVLALFPILIAIIWAVGLMGYFSVPFTSLSTGIVSLVLGIGVDFSIHLVDGIKKKIEKTKRIRESIQETLQVSGKAIFLSSFTTIVGFLALTFAEILATQRLGFSLAFGMLSVFLVAMLVVPSSLSIIYRRKLRKEVTQANA